ncbi:hypothetical protein AM493_14415 [Flavobacterium akiainvivens]|uniref:O-antigen ligase-related domain-containing protein n=1 Tax=Flavobacterium akiainvivens TaxID=1202724 RepID=A0A0M9VIW0_9FLAO|nr:O-antigen ligase family protein [Flavobacterium akiainvivens]KOS07096.1 hypothetical protein AM493_14415 [Flavobacterium akiainvivens]SFQ75595.1 O-Antigen ligase [Flavobacterium akiainvivens]
MKIQEPAFHKIYTIFVALIASSIVLRMPCTILLICFLVFNLVYVKRLQFSKPAVVLIAVVALPFLLEVLFFWNNSSVSKGLKAAEKTVSMLFLPVFIIGNYRYINLKKILFYFSRTIVILLLLLVVRFVVVYPDYVTKYLNGIDLFEVGYFFSDTFKSHAPALNMHLAFAGIINFYFTLNSFTEKKNVLSKLTGFFFLAANIGVVFLVGTRVALLNMLAGFAIISLGDFIKSKNKARLLKMGLATTVVFTILSALYIKYNPYVIYKYKTELFMNMDKVGRLDELEHPEYEAYGGLVTRLSIWKSALNVASENLPFGTGSSDGKPKLMEYYLKTGQYFLHEYHMPVHNQYLDFFMRFGIIGAIAVLAHILLPGFIGFKLKHPVIICFFMLFFISNLTDDFLIRFDGIVFSAVWCSIFSAYWLQQKLLTANKAPVSP